MKHQPLYAAVHHLAQAAHHLTERDLSQPWQWRAHKEGVRFALIGTYHELRTLSVRLRQARAERGVSETAVNTLLAHHHAAYRDLQAVLLGVPDKLLDHPPAPGEWPLRRILSHIIYVECFFFTLVHDGLLAARTGVERPVFSEERVAAVIPHYAELEQLVEQPTRQPLLAFYDRLHQSARTQFAGITDAELQTPSPWWEGEMLSLAWRLHRFDAHLREHAIQIEKTLAALDVPLPEGKRQLRLVYQALADVESVTIGLDDLYLGERSRLAAKIERRVKEITAVLQQIDGLVTAVAQGNLDQIETILEQHPALVDARDPNRLPITLLAAYHQQPGVITHLLDSGAQIDLFTAAAIGQIKTVQQLITSGYKAIDETNLDGFTPLHLSAYFNQKPIAKWLIEQGAGVDVVSQNKDKLYPLHAAAAGGSLDIMQMLLAAGANPNAQQAGGFTPLHTAAQNNNQAMTALLLTHGADPNIANDQGQIPHELSANS